MTRSRRRKLQRLRMDRSSLSTRRRVALLAAVPLAPVLLAGTPVALAQQEAVGLEEIIVTARKREESLQRVPVAVQALGSERLQQLNVSDFDDYVKFLPSVSYQTFGPGFAQVYMRGVVSGGDGNHSGSLPSVGIYLDEQPITTIQGALDVHLYDIARVEALAGPQGTLFGASSQSGTLRIITNRPDPDAFAAGYGIEANTRSGGDEGYLAEGFVNLPISDNAAIRLVGWGRHDAGYIDNVEGTRTYPTSGVTASNSNLANEDSNEADTYGARAALRINLGENWTVTPAVMGQKQEAKGTFSYDRTLGENKVIHFNPEDSDDRWVQAALTVEGRIGNFDLVYAGAYLDRDVDTQSDYSDYSYWYDTLYGYGSSWVDDNGDPINPSQYIQGKDNYEKFSHEVRVSSPSENRLRFTAGLFYQKNEHRIEQRYLIAGLGDQISVTGWPDTIWLTQQMREDEDSAAFGEIYYDITDKLTATAGIRFFDSENSLEGFFGFSEGYSGSTGQSQCPDGVDGSSDPDFNGAPCKNLERSTEEDGNTPKFNLAYRFTDDKMVYATYAEGFRPGGINRRGSLPPYKSDYLTSYELGWKTLWAGNRLRFNGAFFMQEWDDFQYSLLGQNGLTEITNAAEAEINGLEMDLSWQVTDGLGISAGVAFLDSELTDNYCSHIGPDGSVVSSDPCPFLNEDTGEVEFESPGAPTGAELPVMPELKANLTARYEFPISSFDAHVQGAVVYVGERESDLRLIEREIIGQLPSYTLTDFSAGLGGDRWLLELFVTNAFDETAELSRFAQCAEAVCGLQTYSVVSAPRTIGLKFSQEF